MSSPVETAALAPAVAILPEGDAKNPSEQIVEPSAAKRPKYETNRRASKPKNSRRSNDAASSWESPTFKAVHQGSYADPDQRRLFSVELPPDHAAADAEKRSKKKVAILLGYVGTNYGGFQINSGVRSIQAELELALLKVGLMRRENFGYPHKYSWSTSGRTDKGVHAAAQTVSLKLEWPSDGTTPDAHHAAALLPILNAALPDDIRVLDLVRTTRPFVAKTQRDRVRYRYMIPSFCLLAPAVLQKWFQETVTPPAAVKHSNPSAWRMEPAEWQQFHDRAASYRLSQEQREHLQTTLQQYVGTHSFHNFTRRCRAGEPRAHRYILDFQVEDPVLLTTPRCTTGENSTTHDDTDITLEWIPTTVTGQSFLLNQIRKMVHCAVEVTRGALPPTALADYLHGPQQDNAPLGLAPAQGLFLDMSFYESYNTKLQRSNVSTASTPPLDWCLPTSPAHQRWQAFRDAVLVPHVAAEEIAQGNFVQHLYRLEHPAYFHHDCDEEEEDGPDEEGEEAGENES